ncbi:MAG TPA: HAD family hydrolase [Bacteroidetes bacterium]|nr:HAD family hydrolase [Bacteroidota bacterium]
MEYQAIIFDLDNTLVDRDAAAVQAYQQWLEQNRPQQAHLLPEIWIREDHGYADPPAFMAWFRATFSLEIEDQAFFDELRPALIAALQPYLGVDRLLAELGARYRLAVLTNGHAIGQRQKLQVTKVGSYFLPENIFVSGEMGVAKPEKAIFASVLAHLGLAASAVLMVGDDPRNDIAGAEALGIATCWISHGRPWKGKVSPAHIIAEVHELNALLL